MEADSYADKPLIREGETVKLPGGTTVSVQRCKSQDGTQHQAELPKPFTQVVRPGESITLPDGSTFSIESTSTQQQPKTPEKYVIRPGETINVPGYGNISVEGSPSRTTETTVIYPGETRHLPGVGTISVQNSPSQQVTPEKLVIRPGETVNVPGYGNISVESSPSTNSPAGKTVIHAGESVHLPGVGTISVERSPSSQSSPGKTLIRPGETINLPGYGTISMQSSPVTSPGKTVIRPGETIVLPDGGTVSVESSPSRKSSTTQLNLRPGESVTLADGTVVTMRETQDNVTYSSDVIRPGETRNIPGVGTVSVQNTTSPRKSSTTTTQLDLKPGESVTLADGTVVTMREDHDQNGTQSFDAIRHGDHDQNGTQSFDAIRPGETRHIPGVGTFSVSKKQKSNASPDITQVTSPTHVTPVKPTNDVPPVNPHNDVTPQQAPVVKMQPIQPTVSPAIVTENRVNVEKPTTTVTNGVEGTVSSITGIKKGVGVPKKKDYPLPYETEKEFKKVENVNIENVDEETPESESLADRIKRFQLSPDSNEPPKQITKTQPPKTAPKPPPATVPKPVAMTNGHRESVDNIDDSLPPPPSNLMADLGFDDGFELPPPPPDFMFEDPCNESLKDKMKKFESNYSIEDQTTTNLSNVGGNQVVMSKSNAKYSVTFD